MSREFDMLGVGHYNARSSDGSFRGAWLSVRNCPQWFTSLTRSVLTTIQGVRSYVEPHFIAEEAEGQR